MTATDRARRAAAIFLLLTAGLFAVGVSLEGDTHSETSETVDADQSAGGSEEPHAEAGHEDGEASTSESQGESGEGETVLGIDAESPATVTLAVLASVALAAGLWFTKRRSVAIATIVVAGLFALFDIAEVVHQLDGSSTGLAGLAGLLAIGHIASAVLAGLSVRMRSS